MRWYGTAVALLTVGCAGTQYFDAAERTTALSPRGDIAAEYEVGDAAGQIADAKVWMRGAYKDRVGDREMTVIEVVFDVDNEGGAPVVLSDVRLRSARAGNVVFEGLRPFRIEGERVVPAGDEGRMSAFFAIPERFDPEDIDSVEVSWALRHAEGTYVQTTPFQQAPPDLYAYPGPYWSPFDYDPFFYRSGLPYTAMPPV